MRETKTALSAHTEANAEVLTLVETKVLLERAGWTAVPVTVTDYSAGMEKSKLQNATSYLLGLNYCESSTH